MNEKIQELRHTTVSDDWMENFADQLNCLVNIPLLEEEQEKKIILMLLNTLLKLIQKYIF